MPAFSSLATGIGVATALGSTIKSGVDQATADQFQPGGGTPQLQPSAFDDRTNPMELDGLFHDGIFTRQG